MLSAKGVNFVLKAVLVWQKKWYILLSVNIGAPFRIYRYFIIKLINILYIVLKILKIVIKSILNLFLVRSPSQINMFSSSQILAFAILF